MSNLIDHLHTIMVLSNTPSSVEGQTFKAVMNYDNNTVVRDVFLVANKSSSIVFPFVNNIIHKTMDIMLSYNSINFDKITINLAEAYSNSYYFETNLTNEGKYFCKVSFSFSKKNYLDIIPGKTDDLAAVFEQKAMKDLERTNIVSLIERNMEQTNIKAMVESTQTIGFVVDMTSSNDTNGPNGGPLHTHDNNSSYYNIIKIVCDMLSGYVSEICPVYMFGYANNQYTYNAECFSNKLYNNQQIKGTGTCFEVYNYALDLIDKEIALSGPTDIIPPLELCKKENPNVQNMIVFTDGVIDDIRQFCNFLNSNKSIRVILIVVGKYNAEDIKKRINGHFSNLVILHENNVKIDQNLLKRLVVENIMRK